MSIIRAVLIRGDHMAPKVPGAAKRSGTGSISYISTLISMIEAKILIKTSDVLKFNLFNR